ncbi:hypothetical protein LIPSTDRAFT_332718 [Lipomyces starkeyi NRRL Y-11557]|uniref:BED-type domain-containing protein n=1 Tax=Lipomyces starkeyi NRRL Y-11557 TaxID=675824 RepID=A0A1E3QGY0_LIPST|nr:hypothetical protein LIPSTDRAFT_332718 [Lipomyces starkeyi NRRL Y-11557]
MRMRIIFAYSQGFKSPNPDEHAPWFYTSYFCICSLPHSLYSKVTVQPPLVTFETITLNSMADSECEILSDSGVDDVSVDWFKRPQRARRLDYRLLNDGSEDEAAPEDRMVKRTRLPSPLNSSEPITPDDSASQLSQAKDSLAEYPQNEVISLDDPSETSLDSTSSPTPSVQRLNTLLWSYFDVSPIPGKLWYPKRGKKEPLADYVIQCKFCSWKTTDSARASSTTNMRSHVNKHRLEGGNDNNDRGEHQEVAKQQSIATMFKKRSEENVAKTLEQNLVRWTVTDHMAFMSIESQAFQQIFRDLPGVSLPITSRRTMARRIDLEFNLSSSVD